MHWDTKILLNYNFFVTREVALYFILITIELGPVKKYIDSCKFKGQEVYFSSKLVIYSNFYATLFTFSFIQL